MKCLAVLGRQPEISLAELESLFDNVQQISDQLATFCLPNDANTLSRAASLAPVGLRPFASQGASATGLARSSFASLTRPKGRTPCQAPDSLERILDVISPDINRLGGTIKLAVELGEKPLDYLKNLPEGKITIGISDYSHKTNSKTAKTEALKLKQILVRHGRSVRVVESKDVVLSTATSLHNGLSGKNERKCELIKLNNNWYRVVGVQDIDAYTKRDQARPMRDARVGMLPPKLAQILINLCGPLPENSRILDPFCGTGVVLQEALLMGYTAYGTDLNERMVEYTEKNLKWLTEFENAHSRAASGRPVGLRPFASQGASATGGRRSSSPCQAPDSLESDIFQIQQGDATSFQWQPPINAVACEGYLGTPMSQIPTEIKLKEQKQECGAIILGFLKNLSTQIAPGTPVVVAAPAWLRPDGTYSRLEILDSIQKLGYNVKNTSREGLLYHRKDQIVARDIIILRKN